MNRVGSHLHHSVTGKRHDSAHSESGTQSLADVIRKAQNIPFKPATGGAATVIAGAVRGYLTSPETVERVAAALEPARPADDPQPRSAAYVWAEKALRAALELCPTCGDVGVVGNGNAMFPEPCPACGKGRRVTT